jgi:hypothetical protein
VAIQDRPGRRIDLPRIVVPAMLLALVWSMSPVAGATSPDGCIGACRTTGRAKTALAWFTTVPASGPVTGVVYADVAVQAGILSLGPGQKTPSRFADVYIARYRYEGLGEPIDVAVEFGTATGSAVSLAIDRRLATAGLTGTFRLRRCTIVDYEATCRDDAAATTIRASWTAIAPSVYEDVRAKLRTRGLHIVESFSGSRRAATAQATLNGRSLGAFISASINDQRSHSLIVNHTGVPLGG